MYFGSVTEPQKDAVPGEPGPHGELPSAGPLG